LYHTRGGNSIFFIDNIETEMSELEMYMNNELLITTHLGEIKSFLQDGFYTSNNPTKHIHKHNYTEIHLIYGGNAKYRVGEKTYNAESGSMLVIPRGIFHACAEKEEKAQYIAFQTDLDVSEYQEIQVNESLIAAFFDEIVNLNEKNDHSHIAYYIAIILSFLGEEKLCAHGITDYGFLINEFFSNNYAKSVKLSDLSALLHLSERQTERLVREHTGKSFKGELSYIRVTMAKHIINTYGLSLSEAAEYVGYRSYPGFWKALKKWAPEFNK